MLALAGCFVRTSNHAPQQSWANNSSTPSAKAVLSTPLAAGCGVMNHQFSLVGARQPIASRKAGLHLGLIICAAALAATAQTTNDNFADRVALSGTSLSVT